MVGSIWVVDTHEIVLADLRDCLRRRSSNRHLALGPFADARNMRLVRGFVPELPRRQRRSVAYCLQRAVWLVASHCEV